MKLEEINQLLRSSFARARNNSKIAALFEAVGAKNESRTQTLPATRLPPLPERPTNAHKGTFGSVLIVAGSQGMAGAAGLVGRAALHGGAGLVTVAIPRCIATVVSQAHPSYMTLWLPDEDGRLDTAALPALGQAMEGKTAVAMGPGIGQSQPAQSVMHHVYRTCNRPLVLDADGLNAFAGVAEQLRDRSQQAPRILTPHPGEFSRLTGERITTVQQHRREMAMNFARRHDVVLVLKGAETLITDGNRCATNTTGSPALATGGTGDVLTGLLVSLLAQGMDAFEAARLGVYLHGVAGEIAQENYSDRYATSVEIVTCLAEAWKRLEEIDKQPS